MEKRAKNEKMKKKRGWVLQKLPVKGEEEEFETIGEYWRTTIGDMKHWRTTLGDMRRRIRR